MLLRFASALTIVVAFLAAAVSAAETSYDPLAASGQDAIATLDLTVHDAARERDIPIRVYFPAETSAAPVVLFSHGLGGARTNNAYLGNHWAARGYVAVFLQHQGSDESVWRDVPIGQRIAAMNAAASGANFLLRAKDVPAVLDQLEKWNQAEGDKLYGRLDLAHVGMSGHSFGAVTTQAVSGQAVGRARPFTDPRIDAACLFSPSSPRGGTSEMAFGQVSIPWLLMTGTEDVAIVGDTDVESRLAVYPALPPGNKYELVLFNAEHSAFSERALPGDAQQRNPNHHRVILALSTAFWDAYLRDDSAARAWLDGEGPGMLLEEKDRWQMK